MYRKKQFLTQIYFSIRPIFETSVFEIKKQWKKFIIFCVITLFFILFSKLFPFILNNYPLPETITSFYKNDPLDIFVSINLAGCFLFSGIICSEFDKKTGLMTFPKINRYKFIFGKFLGCYLLLSGITTIYYFIIGLIGFYFYGLPIEVKLFYAYGIALLYIFLLGSFITFFSSLMKTEAITIIIPLLLIFIGFPLISFTFSFILPNLEPFYSLEYLERLLISILEENFPQRFIDETIGSSFARTWMTPSVSGGISAMIIYSSLCLLSASILFKRRIL